MTARRADAEDVLAMFAAAYHDAPAALGEYCGLYPDMAADFAALAHEIALVREQPSETPLATDDEAWLAEATASFTAPVIDPFATIAPTDYPAIRRSLGVPAPVVAAFRNRLVLAGSVPAAFLSRFATQLGVGAVDLARYLAGPPQLSATASHKADTAPKVSAKMTFETILIDANVPADQRDRLLEDDD